jgi:hypothetical protein
MDPQLHFETGVMTAEEVARRKHLPIDHTWRSTLI